MISRRQALTGLSAIAAATLLPSVAQAGANSIVEYDGPDDPEAFVARANEMSKGTTLLVFYHAVWCPHCRVMAKQFEDLRNNPDVRFSVLKLDTDKFPKSKTTNPFAKGVPDTMFLRDGKALPYKTGRFEEFKQVITPTMSGRPSDTDDLLKALKRMGAVPAPEGAKPGPAAPKPVS